MLFVSGHSHNLPKGALAIGLKPLTYGVLPGPKMPGHCLADDCDFRRRACILIGETAPFNDCDAIRVEVSEGNVIKEDEVRALIRRLSALFGYNVGRVSRCAERRISRN